jgi:hypothetical protein
LPAVDRFSDPDDKVRALQVRRYDSNVRNRVWPAMMNGFAKACLH